MTTISAQQVKDLRERTGAGMMECKRALQESGGDVEAAIEAMRISGKAKADKKASRVAAEGLIIIKLSDDQKLVVMTEVNSETDFVARDENFLNFVNTVTERALATKTGDLSALMALTFEDGGSVSIEDFRKELITKIGENVQVRRHIQIESPDTLGTYVHGGRIGVLVELKGGNSEVARDIAMHIAASNPLVINEADIPEELIAKEREIYTARAADSGKPQEIMEKIVEGSIKKFVKENTLMGQPFVKDPSVSIEQFLKSNNATMVRFERFEVGEGIEKKKEDFAEEVMAQVRGD